MLPAPLEIEKQSCISWSMRKTLVLWLIEVHLEYGLLQESLYLTVNLLDRMCSLIQVSRHQYQLLGITCLWIAAKYHENYNRIPSLKKLVFICRNCYKSSEVIKMEQTILISLKFDIGAPTQEFFLASMCRAESIPNFVVNLARYIMEQSLAHRRFVGLSPSVVSMSSLILAKEYLGCSRSLDSKLALCIDNLDQCMSNPLPAIYKKVTNSDLVFASFILQR
jgi:hypothetical protein